MNAKAVDFEQPLGRSIDLSDAARRIGQAMWAEVSDGDVEVVVADDRLSVSIVRLMAGTEQCGHGTRAMQAAIAIADELGVRLTLTPDGSYYEDTVAAEARLRPFYTRFGFVAVENGTMARECVVKLPVVARYLEMDSKWYLCHAASYQNAFRREVNGFATRDEAVRFAEREGCTVQLHENDPLQALTEVQPTLGDLDEATVLRLATALKIGFSPNAKQYFVGSDRVGIRTPDGCYCWLGPDEKLGYRELRPTFTADGYASARFGESRRTAQR